MDPLSDLVGESAAMQAVREQIRRLVARREGGRRLPSIHITGETGTGKGLVARTIHRAGARSNGPFVDVNCAAIPETLLEAELFGFERGAFTDARRSKPGLFQAAHRGTIFLDEVGLLSESTQAKLLKVLEEQAVRRLGATAAEPVDTWIISATNADLQDLVRRRAFREDLYHRLAVLPLKLPPLRDRGRDVLILAARYLARVCASEVTGGEDQDIPSAITQWRQLEGQHSEAMVEVLPEGTPAHQVLEVGVGGADDPRVHRLGGGGAQPPYRLLLQHLEQLGLRRL